MAINRKEWPQRLVNGVSLIRPHLTLVNILRLIWLSTVFYGERHTYKSIMASCDWDHWEKWGPETAPHRMVLIADPQIIDRHTYARRGMALSATIFYTDLFMARSYDSIIKHLDPSTVLFLGDLFDGGREWESDQIVRHHPDAPIPDDPAGFPDWKEFKDEYWLSEYSRFSRIFPVTPYRRTVQSLPGNHDIGVGDNIKESIAVRFRLFFGEGNSLLALGNHSIVLLDTPSLLNDVNPRIFGPPRDFLESLPEMLSPEPLQPHFIQDASTPAPSSLPPPKNPNPVILLTHIPLYRPPNTPCGEHRQSPNPIRIGNGYQYTNTIPESLSEEILRKTGAAYVFSGDDHDSCRVTHENDDGAKVLEATIRTFAWTMGVRRPGFTMVSLLNDGREGNDETIMINECVLPDQIGIYLHYVELLVETFILVLLNVLRRRRLRWRQRKESTDRESLFSGVKEEKSSEFEGDGKQRGCFAEFSKDIRDVVVVVIPFYLFSLLLW